MPYILILIGLVFLLYAISRLMRQSNSPKLTMLFRYGGAALFGGLGFLILIRGNVAIAGILAGMAYLSARGSLWRLLITAPETGQREGARASVAQGQMSRDEALSILDLSGQPTQAEIKEAHHKLMMKIHPDQGGSDYFASKLNQARDFLLKD